VDEAVTITATGATSDLYYRFYVNNNPYCWCDPDWELLRDWSTENTFMWTPATNALYTLVVWTTDDTTDSSTGMGGMTFQVGGGLVDFPPCDDDSLGKLPQWETDFIESGSLPQVPAASFLSGEEGLALAYRDWIPDNWDGEGTIVLFVHGSSAHSAEYSVLGEGLSRNGVYARFIDVRGHGLSICTATGECDNPEQIPRTYIDDNRYYPGRIGDAADTNQFIRDLNLHIQDLKGRWPAAAGIHLAGHSSGGGLVARFVQYNGTDSIDSVALLAPYLHYEQRHADTGAKGVPRCACVAADYAQVQPEALVAALQGHIHRYVLFFNKEEPLLDSLDTLQNTYSAMMCMQVANIDNYYHSFTKPTLWVAAELDTLFDLDLAREELALYPGGGVFVTVRNTSHVGLIWSDAVAAMLAQWVTDPDSVRPGYIAP
jgi:pimeloyl-ACP methyl ester carboxylesterase